MDRSRRIAMWVVPPHARIATIIGSSYLIGCLLAFEMLPVGAGTAASVHAPNDNSSTPAVLGATIVSPVPSTTLKPVTTTPQVAATITKSTPRVGIAAGSILPRLSPSKLAYQLDGMKALGISWVRYDFEWDNIGRQGPGQYNWTDYDRVVAAVNARGLKTIGVIDYTPSWARSAGCNSFACEPVRPADYGQFAAAVASRYRASGLHTWEIWNEPNNLSYFKPAADPAMYADMLKSAYTAIKSVDPGAQIVTGGLSPASTGGGFMSPVDFVKGLYANGARGYFDALGDHPYTFPVTASYPSASGAWGQLQIIRGLMVAGGDSAKSIWITEYGAPTGGPGPAAESNSYAYHAWHISEAMQVQAVTDFFAQTKKLSWLGLLLWYSYQDAGATNDTNENFFGLVRYDGSLKPAYYTFANSAAALR